MSSDAPLAVEPMPYKFNESRRHKIPKARYRVANWPQYNAALVRRGSLTVWFTEEAATAWHAPATGAASHSIERAHLIMPDRFRLHRGWFRHPRGSDRFL